MKNLTCEITIEEIYGFYEDLLIPEDYMFVRFGMLKNGNMESYLNELMEVVNTRPGSRLPNGPRIIVDKLHVTPKQWIVRDRGIATGELSLNTGFIRTNDQIIAVEIVKQL